MNKIGAVSFEIGMVIAIIALSIVSIFFYLNVKHLVNRAYDVKRLNDTNTISEAISLYIVEKGHIPSEITASESEISDIGGKCINVCDNKKECVNLLKSILPYLQIKNLSSLDGYSVRLGRGGMVVVRSCLSRTGEIIEVTR